VGLLNTIVKAGVAKKLFDEARKPENQARAKELYRQLKSKGKR
jgi:hypothetical protein